MTIAERIRMEKMNDVEFNAAAFMEKVSEIFGSRPYDYHVYLEGGNVYRNYPSLCKGGNIYYDLHERSHQYCIDRIVVPTELFARYVQLLQQEGFHIYYDKEFSVKVALFDRTCIRWGVNTYYQVKNINR